jgi:FimV-like protein
MKFRTLMLTLLSATAVLSAAETRAQMTYTVGQGETVMTIAAKLRYPKASENQMAVAIVRSNPSVFSVRSKERLQAGSKLTIPSEAAVLSYKPEVADAEAAKLRKGEESYQVGLAAEKGGDMKGAVKAYIEAARFGHPLADLRLGQLYDKDASKTLSRDLQESITHYQKAREFGIEIKGPTDRAPDISRTGK